MDKIKNKKREMLGLLDQISKWQREIDQCQSYYRSLEGAIEAKRKSCSNEEERSELTREIAVLNREFETKIDLLYEDLNEQLLKGYDLACMIGREVGHDFKALWHYMTHATKEEVKTERVLRDIDHIKKDLSV
ncbi:MAG: hypothetical protein AAF443_00030 [Chlamydiota bacterium]